MSRRRSAFALASVIAVVLVVLLSPPEVPGETAWISGRSGMLAVGDTIQFYGDAGMSVPSEPHHCPGWDEGCLIDRAFGFRQVYDVDVENCTFESANSVCRTFAVVCCYWSGSCEGEISGPCNPPEWECWETEQECGNNCYCLSLWRVVSFNAMEEGQDSPVFGCYQIELLCDPDDEDCLTGTGICTSSIVWWRW